MIEKLLKHLMNCNFSSEEISDLRKFFIALAVRGKLTFQDLEDQSTDSLIEHITTASINAPRTSVRVELEENEPFEIPSNWKFVRLGESIGLYNGKTFKSSEWSNTGTKIIRIQNLNNPAATFNRTDIEVPTYPKPTTATLIFSCLLFI